MSITNSNITTALISDFAAGRLDAEDELMACESSPARWLDASRKASLMRRSHSKTVAFSHPFELKGVDRMLPPGNYRVVTDEELIEQLSFPAYRRISTMIFVPGETYNASVEMVAIDPLDLQATLDRDGAIPSNVGTD